MLYFVVVVVCFVLFKSNIYLFVPQGAVPFGEGNEQDRDFVEPMDMV